MENNNEKNNNGHLRRPPLWEKTRKTEIPRTQPTESTPTEVPKIRTTNEALDAGTPVEPDKARVESNKPLREKRDQKKGNTNK